MWGPLERLDNIRIPRYLTELRPYKITNLILVLAHPKFYQPPAKFLLLLRIYNDDLLPNILKIDSSYVADLARLVSIVIKK